MVATSHALNCAYFAEDTGNLLPTNLSPQTVY